MQQPTLWSRRRLSVALAVLAFGALPASGQTAKELRIGVQFGLGYLPLYVANEAGFFARDPQQATAIYNRAEKPKLASELITQVLADRSSLRFALAPEHSGKIAEFLARAGSIKKGSYTWTDFFFPDIHGEAGS